MKKRQARAPAEVIPEAELQQLDRWLESRWDELFIALVGDCRGREWWTRENDDDYVLNRAESLADRALDRLRKRKLAALRRAYPKLELGERP